MPLLDDDVNQSVTKEALLPTEAAIGQGAIFSLTSEQRLLEDGARRFIRESYRFGDSGRDRAQCGLNAAIWRRFGEMGWLGLLCPEEDGGFGGSPIDLAILMQTFGRGLVTEPYLATVILGGGILAAAGSSEQKRKLLPALIAGDLQLAVGFLEASGGYDPGHVETTASCAGSVYTINGRKAVVFNAPAADYLIVSARTTGATTDPFGISLFLIRRDAPGFALHPYPTIDGRSAAEVVLTNVTIGADARIGNLWDGLGILERVIDQATLACASEALGALEAAIEMTVDHLGTREQFGRKLSSFQVLRHRVVDMYVAQEELRSLIFWALHEQDPALRKKAISAAKIFISERATKVMLDTIQLHGAIAMTDAFPIGNYVKRLTAIDRMFGSAAEHLDRYNAG